MSSIPRPVARATLLLAVAVIAAMATPGPTVAAGVTITIRDRFDPETVQVAPGTRITWVNASGNRHRVRTTAGPVKIDSGNLDPGERFTARLSAVGTYRYRDAREPGDRSFWATIVVSDEPAGGGGGTGAGASPSAPASLPTSGSVGMAGRAFGPTRITIAEGGTVTWRNDDDRAHTVTATGQTFDSGTLESGATFRQVFSSVGSFAYLCVIHPEMTGTIVVRASGGTASPTAAPPSPSPSQSPIPTPTPTPASPSATPDQPGPTGSTTVSLRVVDFAFEPGTLTVPAGTQVTAVNAGEAPHTVTADDGSFDSGTIPAAGTWTSTLALPGTFAYRCAIHPDMTGVIEVTAASATEPSASAAALVPAPVEASGAPGAVGGVNTSADVPVRATPLSDYVRVLVAILVTGTAAVLFMRTIGAVSRRPDQS